MARVLTVTLPLDDRGQPIGCFITTDDTAPSRRPAIPRAINRTLAAIRAALRAAREAAHV